MIRRFHLGRFVGQQEQPETQAGDGQHRAGGPAGGPDAAAVTHSGPQTLPVPRLEGGGLVGTPHHPGQFPFEVIHGALLHWTGSMTSARSRRSRATPRAACERAVPTGQPSTSATCPSGRSW